MARRVATLESQFGERQLISAQSTPNRSVEHRNPNDKTALGIKSINGWTFGRESNRVTSTPRIRPFTAVRQQTIDLCRCWCLVERRGAKLTLLRLNETLSHFISSQRRCESNSILQFVALHLQICECDAICIHFKASFVSAQLLLPLAKHQVHRVTRPDPSP